MAGHHRCSVKTQASVFPLNRPQLCTALLMMHQSDHWSCVDEIFMKHLCLHNGWTKIFPTATFSHANYVPLLPSDSTDS
ncbi:hypothetical protein T4B_3213 [Trichinella pseudospiralis]|uniref:Uncharacterized protein n=1 Tax=Trichinella pseudospiralis TaxID=6337 RepID=A0A0V1IYR9_TRIPS|nr:hypothetical protein T4A_5924 [Trichinella pseudospiralis]KRZ27890.1 hypothetical protein T4B_3213 [Trichinella pseudospiralis]KRZ43110.1 hypothetical protein T4C_4469 [Trichinella pseudospiralis]